MGVGFSAPAAATESAKGQHLLVQDDEADPERGQAVRQHREEAEEEHLKVGEIK